MTTTERLERRLADAVAELVHAANAETVARKHRDRTIRALVEAGVSYRRIGELAGMSHVAVAKIVNAHLANGKR
jgi:hypothetical protein